VKTDLDTLATALYVKTDDLLKESPQLAPWRPGAGIGPKLSDAELVTLAVMQALCGFTSEARWLRYARAHLRHLFPYLPQQPGYNKRLRNAGSLIRHCIRALAVGTSAWTDDVWVVDSTPVECGRSRETAKRSDLAGWAEYGYCASHSRYFWGLRLHLVATLQGLPVAFALTGAKADERQVLLAIFDADPAFSRNGPARPSSGTGTTTAPPSRRPWPGPAHGCCARPANKSPNAPAPPCSSRCARSSSRSTTPSKASSISNATVATPPKGSPSASCNASSPSPPPSGTTTELASPSSARSWPMTTDPLESII
jgi:Transposase DDE domain